MKISQILFLVLMISLFSCEKETISEPEPANLACDTYLPFYELNDSTATSLQIECKCQDEEIDLADKLSSFPNVKIINYKCDANQFDQIPEMPSVTQLTSEILTDNVTAFPNLEVFKNAIAMDRQLPYQLRFLPHLREMVLFNVSSLPGIIGDIPLERFKMTYERNATNSNISVSPNLPQLKNLTELKVKNMDLIICTDYENLTNLESLIVENTTLARVPSVNNQWAKLKTLEMTEVDFRGNLPDIFDDMDSLETIYMSEMEVNTTMQDRIYKAPNLKKLTLSYCELSPIPDEIGNLTTLTQLIISTDQNQVNNPIVLPATISNLTNLKSVFISTNTSQFPRALLGLANTLESMTIQDNIGSVPVEIGNFTALKSLRLTNCGLSNLPSTIQSLSNSLEKLYLAGNDLSDNTKQQIQNWLPNTDIYF